MRTWDSFLFLCFISANDKRERGNDYFMGLTPANESCVSAFLSYAVRSEFRMGTVVRQIGKTMTSVIWGRDPSPLDSLLFAVWFRMFGFARLGYSIVAISFIRNQRIISNRK